MGVPNVRLWPSTDIRFFRALGAAHPATQPLLSGRACERGFLLPGGFSFLSPCGVHPKRAGLEKIALLGEVPPPGSSNAVMNLYLFRGGQLQIPHARLASLALLSLQGVHYATRFFTEPFFDKADDSDSDDVPDNADVHVFTPTRMSRATL